MAAVKCDFALCRFYYDGCCTCPNPANCKYLIDEEILEKVLKIFETMGEEEELDGTEDM